MWLFLLLIGTALFVGVFIKTVYFSFFLLPLKVMGWWSSGKIPWRRGHIYYREKHPIKFNFLIALIIAGVLAIEGVIFLCIVGVINIWRAYFF